MEQLRLSLNSCGMRKGQVRGSTCDYGGIYPESDYFVVKEGCKILTHW